MILRLHPESSVKPDGLPVEVGVLHDALHQVSVGVRVAQHLGEGHIAGQEVPHLVWHHRQDGRVKQT